jgi:hypothetical protein
MFYEKHKIFLYKEDFEKFTEGLREAVAFAGNGVAVNTATHEEEDTVAAVAGFRPRSFRC